ARRLARQPGEHPGAAGRLRRGVPDAGRPVRAGRLRGLATARETRRGHGATHGVNPGGVRGCFRFQLLSVVSKSGIGSMHRRLFLAASAAATAGLGPLISSSTALAAENGVSDGEIVLGHTGILSGPLGAPIQVVMAGAGLAFDAVNAQGGLAGRKIKLVSLDDELKPEKAVANYEKLLAEHRAFAFFGCVGSGTTAAAAKVLGRSGAPMVGGY